LQSLNGKEKSAVLLKAIQKLKMFASKVEYFKTKGNCPAVSKSCPSALPATEKIATSTGAPVESNKNCDSFVPR